MNEWLSLIEGYRDVFKVKYWNLTFKFKFELNKPESVKMDSRYSEPWKTNEKDILKSLWTSSLDFRKDLIMMKILQNMLLRKTFPN